MIDFHDNPIPFSGLERTYPNYLSVNIVMPRWIEGQLFLLVVS